MHDPNPSSPMRLHLSTARTFRPLVPREKAENTIVNHIENLDMSKRLSKRQQREEEELEQLKAQEKSLSLPTAPEDDETPPSDPEDAEVNDDAAAPVNPFAALGGGDDAADSEEEEEEVSIEEVKKSTKKKNKKKKKKSTTATPALEDEDEDDAALTPASGKKKRGKKVEEDGMDEVDRALAQLGLTPAKVAESSNEAGPSDIRKSLAFRNLLSVDPKNLDADAELRRFFGSKVIASGQAGSKNHRGGPSAKLRYTISKPKPAYPPATSLAGLVMRELKEDEVEDLYANKGRDWEDRGERWFTFEHSGAWREVERQFLGAVRSHDPNELMALLQVYPWHVDTLLQVSEVHRLQSDIGAASDFAERALYAFDRCLVPSFNVSSGTCRLDFDRVENRAMFTALHRIISYLGRRGCWVTAFNFAKLLFSIDPLGDPHGAAFWLDFLAVKSGNGEWLIQMLEQASSSQAAAVWHGYPGMAYSQALALRADEDGKKHGDHTESDSALQEAIKKFPQVVIPLADKVGAAVPDSARSHSLLQVEASYSADPSNVMHLLSHIYVARSEALWKEPSTLSWFQTQVRDTIPLLDSKEAGELRSTALAQIQTPRDPSDELLNVPMHICRHVLCSESTSWLGFLPPQIKNSPFNAYDPLPPSTTVSAYDAPYFKGIQPSRRARARATGRGAGAGVTPERLNEVIRRILGLAEGGADGIAGRLEGLLQEVGADAGDVQTIYDRLRDILDRNGNQFATPGGDGDGDGGMPGAFPDR